MTYSVSRLGRRYGLSRSTLLYYDRIGLLSASARSAAGYRVYGERDVLASPLFPEALEVTLESLELLVL